MLSYFSTHNIFKLVWNELPKYGCILQQFITENKVLNSLCPGRVSFLREIAFHAPNYLFNFSTLANIVEWKQVRMA